MTKISNVRIKGLQTTNLCIKFVRGSMSFLPRRGSRGVKAPNCKQESGKGQNIGFKSLLTNLKKSMVRV